MTNRKACPLSETWYYPYCSHYHEHELMGKLYDCPGRIACQNFKHMLDIHEKQISMLMGVMRTPNETAKSSSKPAPRKRK
jgi:hypothetical protein